MDTTYENRIIFFADILGFRKMVESSVDADGNPVDLVVKKIDSVLYYIRMVWDIGENMDRPTLIDSERITHFSDTIVVSFKIDEESGVYRTLDDFHQLVCYLASEGIFVRGGIARGALHHSENALYGPALIAAYDLERKVAKNPRIILDNSIIEAAIEYGRWGKQEGEWLDRIVSKDEDGYYFIDYFKKAGWTYPDPWRLEYVTTLREHILAGLAQEDADVRKKYEWAAKKFNDLAAYCHSGIIVSVDSEEEASDYFQAYQNIEPISV